MFSCAPPFPIWGNVDTDNRLFGPPKNGMFHLGDIADDGLPPFARDGTHLRLLVTTAACAKPAIPWSQRGESRGQSVQPKWPTRHALSLHLSFRASDWLRRRAVKHRRAVPMRPSRAWHAHRPAPGPRGFRHRQGSARKHRVPQPRYGIRARPLAASYA